MDLESIGEPMNASQAEPRAVTRRRVVAALALSLVTGLLTVACGSQPATPTAAQPSTPAATPPPQVCASGPTQPSNRFAAVHGYITYADATDIWAADPNHPEKRISLGPSHGLASPAYAQDGSRAPMHGLSPIAWSRDGSRLLLKELRDAGSAGVEQDLCVMHADGSQKPLTSDGRSGEGSFSPDGTKVVFVGADAGLYVVDAEGGTPLLIARSYMAWWLGSPAWSPDGSRIAYTVYQEGGPEGFTFQIWTVNPDGTDPRRLVDLGECGGGDCSGGLAWSPDGSMLAFHSMRDNLKGRTWGIYVVHADGSGMHRIKNLGYQPIWSPDGSRIAYTQGPDVFTMASDGSDDNLVEDLLVVPYMGWAWNPVR
jgi:Tol biopolymer transport system component